MISYLTTKSYKVKCVKSGIKKELNTIKICYIRARRTLDKAKND